MALSCIGLLFAVFSTSTSATEGGGSNYLPGFYGDFAMAVMPEKGTFLNNFFAAYQDKAGQAGTLSEMPGILHASGNQILGANYIVGIYPGLVASAYDADTHTMSRFGLGDTYLIPLALNWQWQRFSALFYEGILAPTGYYEKYALNAGRNIWTFDHILSLTWTLPANNELSVTLGYMNNLKNSATDYQSGDEFHFDYTLGHYFNPEFAIGIAGSHYLQTTADQAPSSLLITEYSEASTIGPVVMFAPHIADRDITVSLKWLHEFNAQGRTAQDYLVWRLFMPF